METAWYLLLLIFEPCRKQVRRGGMVMRILKPPFHVDSTILQGSCFKRFITHVSCLFLSCNQNSPEQFSLMQATSPQLLAVLLLKD